MPRFDENTRVKFPATVQFMRLGYEYQSIYEDEIDFETKIFKGRFHKALEKINNRSFTDAEIDAVLKEINTLISNKDMGKSFYHRIILQNDIKLEAFIICSLQDHALYTVYESCQGIPGISYLKPSGFYPREIQYIINKGQEHPSGALDGT